ncbi:uncharacterized protein LOC111519584 [Drosophila willistoni]|uniref:uncharacterized protein LOC111519584 n=1 Tax=Drosophila willistoni TaxID=7260 RepID=UPI000C26D164|nr:uncharacterized protein LOC111519584 [Drosophila willistoni]XP_023036881.1 uncharacterized protein LOC111519584 [Drosophila willistoni]XP_023036882.1 uncharacterized protein LOC111519584 [Drosophila willistoni]XP_046865816.1 uncharacterized protein LOC111519584 [Drosophila willistoni]
MYNPDPLSLFEHPDDKKQREKIRNLQKKMKKILDNETEIMTLLSLITADTESFDSGESEIKYFPIRDLEEMAKLDAELSGLNNQYKPMMKRILIPNPTAVTPLSKTLPKLFSAEILTEYNYEGVNNKKKFKQFKNINATIFNILKRDGYTDFEYVTELRYAFKAFKSRYYKRKYDERKKLGIKKPIGLFPTIK